MVIEWWPVISGFPQYPHYLQIGIGTLAFVVGSIVAVLMEGLKKRKRLRWIRIILVPIILSAGALLTTKGWNTWNQYVRDESLIFAIAKDWKMNDMRIMYINLQRDGTRRMEFKNLTSFPIPVTDGIKNATTFNRFNASRNDYFVKELFRYTYVADVLAIKLERINDIQAFPIPFTSNEPKKSIFESAFGPKGEYTAFVREHRILEHLINLNFPWVMEKLDKIDSTKEFYWWNREYTAKIRQYLREHPQIPLQNKLNP